MAKTLEQSFERLEEIIAQMEKSDTTLDASFKMYQEGYSLTAKRDYLERLKLQMEYLNPVNQIYDKRQRLMNIEDKLNMLIKRCVADNRNRLRLYASRLEGLSPLKKLDMGYGYIEDSQNDRIISVSQVSPEDEITVYLKDGSIRSKVIEVGEAWQKH